MLALNYNNFVIYVLCISANYSSLTTQTAWQIISAPPPTHGSYIHSHVITHRDEAIKHCNMGDPKLWSDDDVTAKNTELRCVTL
jgi:hypothetical protein